MAKDTSLSLADLEKLISNRTGQLDTLLKKRDELEAEVESLDAQLQEFVTTGSISKRGGRKRPRNEAPLRRVMLEVLGKTKRGLSLADLSQRIKETGYKSHSHNFKNVVYQCLYNTKSVVRDDATGCYKVKQ